MKSINDLSRRSFVKQAAAGSGMVLGFSSFVNDKDNNTNELSTDNSCLVNESKVYFPMLLGNGKEHVLIGYSGAMGACAGHEHWTYNETMTGWFRPDTRHIPSYGVVNILQNGYFVLKDYHAIGIESFEQRFDSLNEVLETTCQFCNIGILRITTYLSDDSKLITRFQSNFNTDGIFIQYFIKSAPGPLAVVKNPSKVSENIHELEFNVVGDGWKKSEGIISTNSDTSRIVHCYNSEVGIEVPMGKTDSKTFTIYCSDNNNILSDINYEMEAVDENLRSLLDGKSNSTLTCSDRNLEEAYNVSLYIMKAHQHPVLGGITIGAYSGMWKNTVYSWDMAFSVMALLGANKIEEANKAMGFWKFILPNLIERNTNAGLSGASAPGGISYSGFIENASKEEILAQRHAMTADIPILAWQLYLYTGKSSLLEYYWECFYEPLKFLMENCIVEFDTHAEIIRSPGTNGKERIDGKSVYYPNPTISLVSIIDALSASIDAAKILNKAIDEKWKLLLPKLKLGINVNMHNGILLASKDSRSAVTKTIHEVGLFNSDVEKNSIIASLNSLKSSEGLLRWTDHGYMSQPWINTYGSAAYTRLGIEGAGKLLNDSLLWTSSLNGFPEAVRPDGVLYKTWYPTVHASFVHAVNLILVHRTKNDVVKFFADTPREWGDISFTNFRVPFGLIVSGTRVDGIVKVSIMNDSSIKQNITIIAFGEFGWKREIELESNQLVNLP